MRSDSQKRSRRVIEGNGPSIWHTWIFFANDRAVAGCSERATGRCAGSERPSYQNTLCSPAIFQTSIIMPYRLKLHVQSLDRGHPATRCGVLVQALTKAPNDVRMVYKGYLIYAARQHELRCRLPRVVQGKGVWKLEAQGLAVNNRFAASTARAP